MERKDHLLDQIEQVGKALARILGRFLNASPTATTEISSLHLAEQLKDELDIDLNALYTMPQNELIGYLSVRHFDPTKMEQFGDLLAEMVRMGDELDVSRQKPLIELAINLYNAVGGVSKTFSFERNTKVEALETLLDIYKP